MQVERLNEELQVEWRKLEQQHGGLHCIDMLVCLSLAHLSVAIS